MVQDQVVMVAIRLFPRPISTSFQIQRLDIHNHLRKFLDAHIIE